ncbi:MAG TPA: GNAT family protein [Frankiaceae bacterium]|nr:GNAT family protein [Frankiaceae bacterium]
MTYAGDLVALRAREPEDAPYLHAWQSDPETMRWWDRVYPPLPPELLAQRLASAPTPSYTEPSFILLDRATGTPIGWCGLHAVSARHRHAELAVFVGDAAYRGKGYGIDAVRTLCRFGFERMNLARVSLTVFPHNPAVRTYERAGFAHEGLQRRAFWKRGEWHDLLHMAVFPDTLR